MRMFSVRWITIAIALGCAGPALSQSNPGFGDGNPLCANLPNSNCPGQTVSLNSAFAAKQDYPIPSAWATLQTFQKGIAIPASGQLFENNGAVVSRINDRVFIGDAVNYSPAACCVEAGTWVAALNLGGLSGVVADVYISSQYSGDTPLFVAARSALSTSAGPSTYPITFLVVNNNTSFATFAWGIYGEAWQLNSNVAGIAAMELEVRNVGGTQLVNDPYIYTGALKYTNALELGCGAGHTVTTNNCSGAVLIFPNQNPFNAGIVFEKSGSLDSIAAIGPNNVRVAISQPVGYSYCWYSATVTISVCEQTSGGFFSLTGNGGQVLFGVQALASAVNYVQVLPATAGNGVTIESAGSDPSPNLQLVAQGAGLIVGASPFDMFVARTVASATGATLDDFQIAATTTTITGTTNITTAKGFNKSSFYQPTYTDSSALTISNAATVYIDNAPLAAGSVTITNPYALWINAGAIHLPGVTTGTPTASVCMDANNNVVKKTTAGSCI